MIADLAILYYENYNVLEYMYDYLLPRILYYFYDKIRSTHDVCNSEIATFYPVCTPTTNPCIHRAS